MTYFEHFDLSCDVSDLYSGSVYFESRPRQRLYCFPHSLETNTGMGYDHSLPYILKFIMLYQPR